MAQRCAPCAHHADHALATCGDTCEAQKLLTAQLEVRNNAEKQLQDAIEVLPVVDDQTLIKLSNSRARAYGLIRVNSTSPSNLRIEVVCLILTGTSSINAQGGPGHFFQARERLDRVDDETVPIPH